MKDWLYEGLRLLLLLAAGAAAAALFNATAAGMLAGLVVWIGWQLYQGAQLLRVMQQNSDDSVLPDPGGAWRSLFAAAGQLQRARQRSRAKYERYQERFRAAADAFPDAALILTRQWDVRWANRASQQMLGLPPGPAALRPLLDQIDDPLLPEYLAGEAFHKPLIMSAPNDRTRMLGIRIEPFGRDGREYLLTAADVTRIYHLDALRRDFVANVSHELRSPLTVLSGYLEAMTDEFGAETEWSKTLDVMQNQTRRMQRMVEDLSVLSRLESESGAVRQEPVAVAGIIESIETEATALSGKQRHDIVVMVETQLRMLGEQQALHSAFSNLVFNAVRHTPDRSMIEIRWYRDGDEAVFSVRDDGAGIADRHLPRLTERFYRVDAGRGRDSGGTGLGLAIVKHVVARHGGELLIRSRRGLGSTFECRFPAAAIAEQSTVAASPK